MKTLSFLMLLFFTFGFTATKNSDSLNGIWIPVKQEIGGTALPPASFEKQKLVISDSAYTFTAESVDKGVVKYASDNKMDIYGKDGVNAGKHFTAIYKYKNEQLSICYNLKGDSYPESFDTKGKPMFFLCVFKKEPAK
ncbi:MAG TPA: TIGR03067 domain-containing protein [Puia sp.]|nr:TIGR03067 domain-containing protein [Puia sp.]